MRSLATAALGLVIVVLDVSINGWDVTADPAGWLLVLVGLHDLRGHPRHGLLVGLATLALAVSAVLWFPAVASGLDDASAPLAWLVSMPQVAWCAVAAYTLADVAGAAGDDGLRTMFRLTAAGFVVAAALPLLAGTDVAPFLVLGALAATLALLTFIVLLFVAARRTWPDAVTPTA
jgi:hypothetical protein